MRTRAPMVVAGILVTGAGGVRAAPAGSEAAVRAVLDGHHAYESSDGPTSFAGQFAGVWLLGPDGGAITDHFGGELATPREVEPRSIIGIDWKLGALTLATDDARGFAWFQAPIALVLDFPYGAACCDTVASPLRVSGIAVRDGVDQSWRVAAVALSRQMPDAALFRGATLDPGTSTTGDSELTTQIAAWFPETGPTTLGGNAAAGVTLVASGTAPKEYATGAAAGKLAAAWDKLGMRAEQIVDARTFAADTVGLVEVDVRLPHRKKAAPMTLYAIVIRDGKTWRWVSLQWTTPLAKPPREPPETDGSANTFTHDP